MAPRLTADLLVHFAIGQCRWRRRQLEQKTLVRDNCRFAAKFFNCPIHRIFKNTLVIYITRNTVKTAVVILIFVNFLSVIQSFQIVN